MPLTCINCLFLLISRKIVVHFTARSDFRTASCPARYVPGYKEQTCQVTTPPTLDKFPYLALLARIVGTGRRRKGVVAMKKVMASTLSVLVLLLLSSCFLMGPDFGDWDGELEGTEDLYNLVITQDGKDLVLTVSLDSAKYAEAAAKDNFYPPEELFFWMSPRFKSDPGDRGSNWNPYEMYPVARKQVLPEFLTGATMVVRVSLERIASDWNRWWLQPYQFDGDEDANPDDPYAWQGDDMDGVFALVSDNYALDNDWDTVSTLTPDSGYPSDFRFINSRPMGTGYSNTAARLDDAWIPVILTPEGLRISSNEIYGGSIFEIQLKLPDGDSIGSDSVFLPGGNQTLSLNASNGTLVDTNEYLWRIVYEPSDYMGTDGGVDVDGVIHLIAPVIYWYDINFRWYWTNFEYRGTANKLFETDFTSGLDLGGAVGGSWTMEPLTVEGSNWGIADIGVLPIQPGLNVTGNVLGLGAGGDPINFYDPNRSDSLVLPAHDYYSEVLDGYGNPITGSNPTEVYVSFDIYKNLDSSWSDMFIIEFETFESYWDGYEYVEYSVWNHIESWSGPKDFSDDNGWRRHTTRIYPYYLQYQGEYGSWYGRQQRIRLRFQSDGWNNAEGVYLDNLVVFTVE